MGWRRRRDALLHSHAILNREATDRDITTLQRWCVQRGVLLGVGVCVQVGHCQGLLKVPRAVWSERVTGGRVRHAARLPPRRTVALYVYLCV